MAGTAPGVCSVCISFPFFSSFSRQKMRKLHQTRNCRKKGQLHANTRTERKEWEIIERPRKVFLAARFSASSRNNLFVRFLFRFLGLVAKLFFLPHVRRLCATTNEYCSVPPISFFFFFKAPKGLFVYSGLCSAASSAANANLSLLFFGRGFGGLSSLSPQSGSGGFRPSSERRLAKRGGSVFILGVVERRMFPYLIGGC